MKTINISGKKYGHLQILIDDADYIWASQYKWYLSNGYARRSTYPNGKIVRFSLHSEIMKPRGNNITDHINHNKLDNRRENLRNCTKSQNNKNISSHKDSLSKYLGVGSCKRIVKDKTYQYWVATIRNNKKDIHLGCFKIEEDAAKAYDKAAKKYHKEFANLNFK